MRQDAEYPPSFRIKVQLCGSACVQVGVSRHSAGYEIVIASWFY
jgi:hypothetical protein